MSELTALTLKVFKVYDSCETSEHWKLADSFRWIVSAYIFDNYDWDYGFWFEEQIDDYFERKLNEKR